MLKFNLACKLILKFKTNYESQISQQKICGSSDIKYNYCNQAIKHSIKPNKPIQINNSGLEFLKGKKKKS